MVIPGGWDLESIMESNFIHGHLIYHHQSNEIWRYIKNYDCVTSKLLCMPNDPSSLSVLLDGKYKTTTA